MKNTIKPFYTIIFFILICAFWLIIVMILGVYDSSITPKNGVLSYTFNWWENTNFYNHLCLGNYLENEISKGTIYTTYTYPFYFVNYILLAPFHYLFGVSYKKLQNILPYINVLFFVYIIYRLKKKEIKELILSKNRYYQIWIFFILGILITNCLPWISMLRNNQENFHMLIAVLFCYLSIICIQPNDIVKKDRKFLVIGLIISCITPIYFPAWLLCYIYLETELKVRKKMMVNILIVILSHSINYILPLAASKYLGLRSSASGYLYRSGLDGSNKYFDSILSVFYSPKSEQHTTSTILLIISVFILGKKLKNNSKFYFNQLIFLSIPVLITVLLFPQFSSIHMYFIEFLIVVPCVFMICYWLIDSKLISQLKSKNYTLSIIFFSFIIMSQLIEIARYFKLLNFLKNIIT